MWRVTLWDKVFFKNERIYQSCVRSAMLYGSETWCLRENEMAILRRIENAMMRAMSCHDELRSLRKEEAKNS